MLSVRSFLAETRSGNAGDKRYLDLGDINILNSGNEVLK